MLDKDPFASCYIIMKSLTVTEKQSSQVSSFMLHLQLQDSEDEYRLIINTLLTRDRWEATLWSKQRCSTNTMNLWKGPTWVWSQRPRRIQAPSKDPPHGKDGVLRFVLNTWCSELAAEIDVAVQRFFGGDEPIWSQHLVLHSLNAQTTKPTTLISLA